MTLTVISNPIQVGSIAATGGLAGVYLIGAKGASIIANLTVNTPTAKTFTAVAATDICTAAAHGMQTGLKLQVSNSGGGLPGGLAAVTDYFAIVLDANTFKLASSLVNAQAGTAIDITTAGTGTQTETPTALAGGAVIAQKSNDNVTWIDIGTSTAVTVSANLDLGNVIDPMYAWLRTKITLTAGQIDYSVNTVVKGNT